MCSVRDNIIMVYAIIATIVNVTSRTCDSYVMRTKNKICLIEFVPNIAHIII